MRYTTLGKTGLKASTLGFGCMRLPEKNGRVDRDLAIPMLRRAVELGVNFFDTATMYCNSDSEAAVGEALEGLRDKIILSTKNPHRGVSPAQWRAQLEESLRRLRTDHLDIYNHHGMNWGEYDKHFNPAKGGLTGEMLKAKKEGLIRHAAFSFHDKPEGLKKLCDTGHYETCILQYNLLDQTNAEAIQYVHDKGMGVIVMGPVGGGRLGIANERIRELTGAASAVEAALRFVWAHPGVNVALSGMQTMEMLETNARLAGAAQPFTSAEVAALNALVKERKEKSGLYCSGCRYCVPVCTSGINIPEILEMMNQEKVFGLPREKQFRGLKPSAVECLDCGKCVAACPQKIEIPARLREAAQMWDPRFGSVVITPVLDKIAADGAFSMTLRANNLAPTATPVKIEIAGDDGARFAKTTAKVTALAPFKRRAFTFAGKADPASKRVHFRATTGAHGTETKLEVEERFLLLPMGAGDNSDWTSGTWQEFRPTAAQFARNGETAPLHGARFRLGRNADTLVMHFDVTDDFLYPTRADRDRGNYQVDGLELFLDGRMATRCGFPGYEPGVWQMCLYPGEPGKHEAFFHAKEPIAMTVESFAPPGGGGYRIVARVPFAAFCTHKALPKRFGFDVAVNSADSKGQRICQYVFAGDGENWRNASKFRAVWLV